MYLEIDTVSFLSFIIMSVCEILVSQGYMKKIIFVHIMKMCASF